MTKKIYMLTDSFFYFCTSIFRRHLLLSVRQMCPIPNLSLISEHNSSYFKQNVLFKNIQIAESNFWEKNWNHRKNFQDLRGQNRAATMLTIVTFGHSS